jgi:hypothetical protein
LVPHPKVRRKTDDVLERSVRKNKDEKVTEG